MVCNKDSNNHLLLKHLFPEEEKFLHKIHTHTHTEKIRNYIITQHKTKHTQTQTHTLTQLLHTIAQTHKHTFKALTDTCTQRNSKTNTIKDKAATHRTQAKE